MIGALIDWSELGSFRYVHWIHLLFFMFSEILET